MKALLRKLIAELGWSFEDAKDCIPAVQAAINAEAGPHGIVSATAFHGLEPTTPLKLVAIRPNSDINKVRVEDVSELLNNKLKEHVTAAKEALNAMHKRLIAKTVEQRRRSRKRSAK